MTTTDEVSGTSPYGASTIAGNHNNRMTTENELAIARFQGKHMVESLVKTACLLAG